MIIRDAYDIIRFVDELKALDLSEPHEATHRPYVPKHTDSQRKTYWMWLDDIVKQGGGTGNRYGLDVEFRKMFVVPTQYTKINGEQSEYLKSVSQLNKKELSSLMREVWVMAHEFGFTLEDPDDLMFKENENERSI